MVDPCNELRNKIDNLTHMLKDAETSKRKQELVIEINRLTGELNECVEEAEKDSSKALIRYF